MRALLSIILIVGAPMACAIEIGDDDVGTYTILNQEHKATGLAFRLSRKPGGWKMEGKKEDGAWEDLTCEVECAYRVSSASDIENYFPPNWIADADIGCIQNVAHAFCRYELKKNHATGGYIAISLVTGKPLPIFLERAEPRGPGFSAGTVPQGPIYMVTANGHRGFFGRGDEYAQFEISGTGVKFENANHVWLKPDLGLMVTFADTKQIGSRKDLLSDHREWELDYWRQNSAKLESAARDDLSGDRRDLKVTEIRLENKNGDKVKTYLIGLASKSGVFVFSISPASESIDPVVREFVASLRLVPKVLDGDEIKRLSLAERDAKR